MIKWGVLFDIAGFQIDRENVVFPQFLIVPRIERDFAKRKIPVVGVAEAVELVLASTRFRRLP